MNVFEGYDALEGQDPYCYEGTTVLRNLIEIQDAETLEAFELEMSTLRAAEPLPDGAFNSNHYKQVHHHLFQDVYAWAGVPRTIQTSKGGNLFCLPAYIDSQLESLFPKWGGDQSTWCQSPQQFVSDVSDFLADLNAIHAFCEGNGRSQLAFIHLLGKAAGCPFDLSLVQRETFLPAMVASFHGQLGPLEAELSSLQG